MCVCVCVVSVCVCCVRACVCLCVVSPPYNCREGTDGEYTYTISLTSALDRGGWLTPRPCPFISGNSRYALCRGLGGL